MIDKNRIEKAVREILLAIGEDPDRNGLIETPKRVANMYEEIFAGLSKDAKDEAKVFQEAPSSGMVVVRDITFYSMCEHHLLPFMGTAHVVYQPNQRGEILGLSKIARIVDILAKKPQLQERLGQEVVNTIAETVHPDGVLVCVEAEHLCMTMRGIKKPGATTATLAYQGIFQTNPSLRKEALSLISFGRNHS